jgi:hypothetical protein
MVMIKILYILNPWRRRAASQGSADAACDPLSHPAIRAMSPAELADLPFETARKR